MKKFKIEDPLKAQQIVWREIVRSPESRYDHRLHGILFVSRGLSCYEAAAIWGRSPRSLEYWVKKYEKNGLNGLREAARSGRPSRLTAAQIETINEDLKSSPGQFGYASRRWTGEALRQRLSEVFGVSFSVRQCQRYLRARQGGVGNDAQ